MRYAFLAALMPLVASAACNDTDTDDPAAEAYTASLSASEAEGDGQALGALAFPRGSAAPAGPGLPESAEQRVQKVKAYIAEHLTCAEATPSGDSLTVVFTRDCTWEGRRWSGSVTFTWTAGGDAATIDFDQVAVNGATLTGSMTVTRIEEGHVTVEAGWTRVGPKHTVSGEWDGDYAWNDQAYTINSASHVVTVDGHSATRTTTGVVWLRQDPSPEAGTVTFAGFRGKTWTMVFGRDEAGGLTITVTGPEGQTRVFTPEA